MYQYSPAGLYYTVSNKFTTGCGTCIAAVINDNAFNATDEITLLRGHHSIIVGGEFVRNQLNFRSGFNSNGNFATNGEYSGSGPNGGSTLGDADLDFLFGLQSSFQQSPQQQEALRGNIPSIYVQDTWHATPRLTAVAGIRWSPDFFPVDYFNHGSVFSMSAFTAGQKSIVFPSAPAGSLFYGDPGVGRNFTGSSPWLFSPQRWFLLRSRGQRQNRNPRRLRIDLRRTQLLHRPTRPAEPALRPQHQPEPDIHLRPDQPHQSLVHWHGDKLAFPAAAPFRNLRHFLSADAVGRAALEVPPRVQLAVHHEHPARLPARLPVAD